MGLRRKSEGPSSRWALGATRLSVAHRWCLAQAVPCSAKAMAKTQQETEIMHMATRRSGQARIISRYFGGRLDEKMEEMPSTLKLKSIDAKV